MQLWYIN